MFSKKQIWQLMIPLMVEQLLTVTVGIADSMMVSVAGEAAVSGVSLVDSLNNLILGIMAALATGGAVVCSQYIGKRQKENACQAANQLLLTSVVLALLITGIMLLGGRGLLQLIFGSTETTVMDHAFIYTIIIVLTYPFMAVYNSAAALFRSMGNSRISMLVSILMNAINISLNAVLIFGFHMGVAGAAAATLAARIVGSILMLSMIRQQKHEIHIADLQKIRPNLFMIRRILYIGIPTGLENGMFQLGRILVLSLAASFGTVSIMANAVAGSLCAFMIIPGTAVSLAMVTIVGQCIGAERVDLARRYTNLLLLLSVAMIGVVSAVIVLLRPFLLGLYHMSPEAYEIANRLMFWHFILGTFMWPLAFNLPNALRAGNDVKYTMTVSMLSMWICRVAFSYLLARRFELGLYGIWIAMFTDWLARIVCFVVRYRDNRWCQKRLI